MQSSGQITNPTCDCPGLAWYTLILPDAPVDLSKSEEMLDKAVKATRENENVLCSQGVLYYRMGEYAKAIEQLTRQMKRIVTASGEASHRANFYTAYIGVFLSMSHQRLGHTEESTEWLKKASSAMQELTREKNSDGTFNSNRSSWKDRIELEHFLREASALIETGARN